MKVIKYLAVVLSGFFLFIACKKELSFERGLPINTAVGSLKDTVGNCLPIVPNGRYVKSIALTDSNYVVVQVRFSSPGSYNIYTDTSNGFSFSASGITADSGLQTITLKGTGTPTLAQPTNFLVTFDTSRCMFTINVSDTALTTPVTSGDYFPTTNRSNWSYQINTLNLDDTAHVAVDSVDESILGNTYRTFVTQSGGSNDTSYYRKDNGLYYTYSNFNEVDIFDTVESKTDYIFLKDNVPVGNAWESSEVNATFASIPGKAKIGFSIQGKDIQTTIGNTTIDSVIQVQRTYMFAPAGSSSYQTIVTADFYYAKNIGFIKAESAAPVPFTLDATRWEIYY